MLQFKEEERHKAIYEDENKNTHTTHPTKLEFKQNNNKIKITKKHHVKFSIHTQIEVK